jgi:beta-keto acid cleavage enzyme
MACPVTVKASGDERNTMYSAISNAEQVLKARQIIEGLGLAIATPDEAREMLALKGADRVSF